MKVICNVCHSIILTCQHVCVCSAEYIAVLSESSVSPSDNIYEYGFDEDFDVDVPIGQCEALYDFDGETVFSSFSLLLIVTLIHIHPTESK